MNQYIITEEELDEWEAGGMCWSEEKDMQRGIRSRPYQNERDKVLEALKKDLQTRIISSSNQWSKGRNSGLLECCNIIDELRQAGEP